MDLNKLLAEKRADILRKWFDLILDTYPADTSTFLRSKKNQFTNPVAHSIYRGIEEVFEGLIQSADIEKIPPYVDDIIRIRAVQDFSPSQAVSFILLFKKVISEALAEEISKNQLSGEVLQLNHKIDKLLMMSFDVYMKCREKLYEIRANEVKNNTYRLLQKANLICEVRAKEPEHKEATKNERGK